MDIEQPVRVLPRRSGVARVQTAANRGEEKLQCSYCVLDASRSPASLAESNRITIG